MQREELHYHGPHLQYSYSISLQVSTVTMTSPTTHWQSLTRQIRPASSAAVVCYWPWCCRAAALVLSLVSGAELFGGRVCQLPAEVAIARGGRTWQNFGVHARVLDHGLKFSYSTMET